MKRIIIAGLLAASGGAQAWGIDASIPLQVQPINPNAFSDSFAQGLELRELQDELDYEEESAYQAHLDDKLRRLLEAEEEQLRAQEALRENLRPHIDAMVARGDQAGWEWCQNRPQPAMVDKREEAAREWCQIQAEIIQEESLVERDQMRDRQIELRRLIDGRSLIVGDATMNDPNDATDDRLLEARSWP